MKTALTILCAVALQAAAAATPDPWVSDPGPLRISGPTEMRDVIERWARGFSIAHPGVAVVAKLDGTDAGYGALVTGRTDIAFGGREIAAQEAKAFEWIFRYPPTGIAVMTGSVDRPGRAAALAVIVNSANPMRAVTYAQLRGMFDADRQDGKPGAFHVWGEAGLRAASWARQPIHLFMPPSESGTGEYFRRTVLGATRVFPWPRTVEEADPLRAAAAVARDRYAVGVIPMSPGLPAGVKVLALSSSDEGAARELTRETVARREYPLARSVQAYVNAAPAKPIDPSRAHPLDPRVAAFLAYVLGPEGQHDAEADGIFQKLAPGILAAQMLRLK